jgi:outer membrane protein OmpA-like peptidoglycan-associated protein
MRLIISACIVTLFSTGLFSQHVKVEAYFYEKDNRGFLNQVKYRITDIESNRIVAEGYSNREGAIRDTLAAEKDYLLEGNKSAFHSFQLRFDTRSVDKDKKLFLSLEMKRKPGYIFEATLAPERRDEQQVQALTGARVEIFNNTKNQEELVISKLAGYSFSHPLEPGNHYSMLIRKEGYYNKRIEAYVDVEGCILCFEGTGELKPGVLDNLTEGLQSGTLLSNLEMKPIEIGRGVEIKNIYYDYDEYYIRQDAKPILDDLIRLLKNNPALVVEMGSHTEARGKDEYNRELSEHRARAVVDYLVKVGGIPEGRLSAFGYGESQLRNACSNGIPCSEAEHQENRRTEMKVIGVLDFDPYKQLSLAEIIRREKSEATIQRIMEGGSEQIQVSNFDELPEEIKRDILRQRERYQMKGKTKDRNPEVNQLQDSMHLSISTNYDTADKENAPPSSPDEGRVIEFKQSDRGYTVLLPEIDESSGITKELFLKNHGRIYLTHLGRYAIGLFDSKRKAKQYSASLSNVYNELEIRSVKSGYVLKR